MRLREQEQELTRCKAQLAERDHQLQQLSSHAEDATRRLTQSSVAASGLQQDVARAHEGMANAERERTEAVTAAQQLTTEVRLGVGELI